MRRLLLVSCLLAALTACASVVYGYVWLLNAHREIQVAGWQRRVADFDPGHLEDAAAWSILNKERQRVGATPLSRPPDLADIAGEYAADLAADRKPDEALLRHAYPDGAEWFACSAQSQDEAAARIRKWAAAEGSPGMSRVYDRGGFGVARSAKGKSHYVFVLAGPPQPKQVGR